MIYENTLNMRPSSMRASTLLNLYDELGARVGVLGGDETQIELRKVIWHRWQEVHDEVFARLMAQTKFMMDNES